MYRITDDQDPVKVMADICEEVTNPEIERLLKKFSSPNFSVFGFYTPLSELYSIADIFLTKPGGLSVMESLQWNLPMIITSMLPGQEELNMQFLLKNNI